MPRSRARWLYRLRRLPGRFWRVMRSSRVPVRDKLLFAVAVALYWVLPDIMPFVPIDDVAVTGLAADWFVRAMERKYGE